jgi:light-regulated signal transduction histidine kinase (bacteriophytochrome)
MEHHLETLRLAKDGRLIDVLISAAPIKDVAGKVIGVSKVAHTITDRKAAEEKIRVLNTELEQRVIERTAQLQAANQELEAFSYSVSHDLRAPLRHIVGFVELLQKDVAATLPAKSLRHLTTISASAKRMGDLIDDLLDFSRFGRSEMLKTAVDLNQLVAKVLSDVEADFKGRQVEWKLQPLPTVWADRPLLRQVLFNLIGNAVKFTAKRAEATIEIGTVPGAPGETVIFVGDNGAGFDPKYIDKLFRVFQRLHSQAEFEGTGIGLANVQRIVQRHGGWVRADGVVDGGATFYFSLPNADERIHGQS